MFTNPFTSGISGIQLGSGSMPPFAQSIPPPPNPNPSSATSNQGMGTLEHYSARVPCILQTTVKPHVDWGSFNWDYQNSNTPPGAKLVTDPHPNFTFKMWNLGQLYGVHFPFSAATTTMFSSYCAIVKRPDPSDVSGSIVAINVVRALENGGSGSTITGGKVKANKIGSYIALGDLKEGDVIALYRNCIEFTAGAKPPEQWRDTNGELFIPGLFCNAYPPEYPASGLVFNKYVELVCVIKYEDISIEVVDNSGTSWKVIVDDFGTIRNATVGIMQYV